MRVGKFNQILNYLALLLVTLIIFGRMGYIGGGIANTISYFFAILTGALVVFTLVDPYSQWKVRSFYIPREKETETLELLEEYGFQFHNDMHGDRIYVRKGSNDFTNLLVNVRELGKQIVIETAGPRAMRRKLKEMSSWSENKILSFQ